VSSQADKFAQAAKQTGATPPATGRGIGYYLRRTMIYIACGYLLPCLALFFFQKRLVYHPVREESLMPQDSGFARAQATPVQTTTSDGVMLKGWLIAGRGKKETATLDLSKAILVDLFFCGNAGNKSDRTASFRRLSSAGAEVVCFDYRGFGDSDGSPDEAGLAKDARAAWDFVVKSGVKPGSIVLHGESLGGAVAIRLAAELCAENTPPAGVITEATFPRMSSVASRQFPFVPVSLILSQTFPSIERIPNVTCPLLMLHGKVDDLVPIALGRELFAAAPAQSQSGLAKQFVELPTAGHNDVGAADADEYLAAVGTFLNTLAPELTPPHVEHGERKRDRKPTPPKPKSPAPPATPDK